MIFFPSKFPTRLMSNDMGLLVNDARETNASIPNLCMTDQILNLTQHQYHNEDYAALIRIQLAKNHL